MAAGILDEVLDHSDVIKAAAAAEPRMIGLLRGVIERL
jgi:hypothetical protein